MIKFFAIIILIFNLTNCTIDLEKKPIKTEKNKKKELNIKQDKIKIKID